MTVLIAASCGGSDIRTVEGTVTAIDAEGIGIVVNDHGLSVGNGTQWLGLDGSWRDSGQPECLPPLSTGATVSLDVLEVDDGWDAVVRVRCLSLPTEVLDPAPMFVQSPYDNYCAQLGGDEPPLTDRAADPCERTE